MNFVKPASSNKLFILILLSMMLRDSVQYVCLGRRKAVLKVNFFEVDADFFFPLNICFEECWGEGSCCCVNRRL